MSLLFNDWDVCRKTIVYTSYFSGTGKKGDGDFSSSYVEGLVEAHQAATIQREDNR